MKTRPILILTLLALGIVLGVGACETLKSHHGGVTMHDTYVAIHPGTKISPDDQQRLDTILKKYHNSLYKVQQYDKGKLVKSAGRLKNVRMDQALLAEVSSAAHDGVSVSTVEIGIAAHPETMGTASHPDFVNHGNFSSHPDAVNHQNTVNASNNPDRTHRASNPDHANHPDHSKTAHPNQVGSKNNPDMTKSEFDDCTELVKRVAPILKKYEN